MGGSINMVVDMLISMMDDKELNSLLQEITGNIISQQTSPIEHISIDGKHLGREMYTVSAFSADSKLSLGHSVPAAKVTNLNTRKK